MQSVIAPVRNEPFVDCTLAVHVLQGIALAVHVLQGVTLVVHALQGLTLAVHALQGLTLAVHVLQETFRQVCGLRMYRYALCLVRDCESKKARRTASA